MPLPPDRRVFAAHLAAPAIPALSRRAALRTETGSASFDEVQANGSANGVTRFDRYRGLDELVALATSIIGMAAGAWHGTDRAEGARL